MRGSSALNAIGAAFRLWALPLLLLGGGCRPREDVLGWFERNVYGLVPPKPAHERFELREEGLAFGGTALRRQYRILCANGGSSNKIDVLVYLPAAANGPIPAFVYPNFHGNMAAVDDPKVLETACRPYGGIVAARGSNAHRAQVRRVLARGFAHVTFCYGETYPDYSGDNAADCYTRDAAPESVWRMFPGVAARPLAHGAWAWGSMRVRDLLETVPEIDQSRVALVGHSRMAKNAVITGVHDARYSLICANGGGFKPLDRLKTLFVHWFYPIPARLPYGQEDFVALIAPRALFVSTADADKYQPTDMARGVVARADAAWRRHGLSIGFHSRPGKHSITAADWTAMLDYAESCGWTGAAVRDAAPAFRLADVRAVVHDARFARESATDRGLPAARDLTNAISRITGRPVALVRDGASRPVSGVTVHLGETEGARQAGIDFGSLRKSEYRIKTVPGAAYLAATTGMASEYAATAFLERFCDYWHVALDGDDPLPPDRNPEVPISDAVHEPTFYSRHTTFWGPNWRKSFSRFVSPFVARNGGRVTDEIEPDERVSRASGSTSHSCHRFCDPKAHFERHPDWFPMNEEGRRFAYPESEICATSAGAFETVWASLEGFIAADRAKHGKAAPVIYDFSREDNTKFMCLCPACKEVAARHGGQSGLSLWFVNRLARRLAAKYPGLILRTFAYGWSEDIHADLVPEPNVMVFYCDLYTTSQHLHPLAHPCNARKLGLYSWWRQVSNHLEVWDYCLYGRSHGGEFPEVLVDAAVADARMFRDDGVRRMYLESSFDYQPFFELNAFALLRLYQDADVDVETLVDRHCRLYRRAAGKMRAAIDFLRGEIRENPATSERNWQERILPWRNERTWKRFLSLLEEARAAEPDAKVRARIARIAASAERELHALVRRDAGRAEEARRDLLGSERLAREALEHAALDPDDRARALEDVRLHTELADLKFTELPPELARVPAEDLVELDARSVVWYRKDAERIRDAAAETGWTARWLPRTAGERVSFWTRFRDEETGENMDVTLAKANFPDDGKYHWTKVSTVRMGRSSFFYFAHLYYYFRNRYVECDGLAEDPNWYDVWISVMRKGEELRWDRLVLRRVRK